MIRERSLGYRIIDAFIYFVLALILLTCILPFIREISISLSGRTAVLADRVGLFPIDLTFDNYGAIIAKDQFTRSFLVSIVRVIVAVPLTLLVVVLTAYPFAMERTYLPGRRTFMVIMIFVNMFQVGLIPRYLSYVNLGLIDNFAVLILPLLLNTFNVILTINFFKGIPFELVESAMLDGATHGDILFKVLVPLSKPVLATLSLFTFVHHWNSWFDGIIYLRNITYRPLQSYLYTMLTSQQVSSEYASYRFSGRWPNVSPKGAEASMVLFAILPVLVLYPFLQRYIISGMTLGAVKQ